MLSLDFLAGFTIFLLALIMVVSMVPGLLAGLGSSGIDYDAVAYRTGVILVEDPGWWAEDREWRENQEGAESGQLWELENKNKIKRVGLAVSRDAPNILLSTKVEKFFNDSFFHQTNGLDDDYRRFVIFGDIPYSYNISLNISHPGGGYEIKQVGDPLPPGYGYIRRVVKIKEPAVAVINSDFTEQYTIPDPSGPEWNSTARNFTVRLDFNRLLDQSINPAYRIDPRIEPVNVTITNFGDYLNSSCEYATLRSVTFWRGASNIPFPSDEDDMGYYTLCIDGNSSISLPDPDIQVSSNISFVLKPAATSRFPLDQNSILDIRFNFEDDYPRTNITGIHYYDYNTTNVTRSDLKTGVLEVAIW